MSTASMREAAAIKAWNEIVRSASILRPDELAAVVAAAIRALPDPAPQPGKEDREVAEAVFESLCDDPEVWATHGMPSDRKAMRIVSAITAALASVREASRTALSPRDDEGG